MNRIIFLWSFLLLALNISSQSRIISGEVVDTSGLPLIGVSINLETPEKDLRYNQTTWSHSDFNGIWAIKVDLKKHQFIHFQYPGFLNKAVKIDTTRSMRIVMEEITSTITDDERYPKPYQPHMKGHGSFQFGIDFNKGAYDGYRALLGDINTDFLSNTKPILYLGFGYEWSKLTLGLNLGFTPSYGDKDLVEKPESDNFFFDLNMGRKIIDTRKWKLKPSIGFKFYNSNLTSTTLEDDASLAEYLDNREIELNFSQPFGYLGMDLEYKFQMADPLNTNYWSIGCYANFQFKLKDTPFLGTQRTQLDSEIPIHFWRINWGISGRMYFGSRI